MERKIGEIFEYNGKWYQCVESKQDACTDCAFNPINGIGYNCSGSCTYEQVIFKKLEKVGEPYTTYVDKTVQNYLLETAVSVPPENVFVLINNEQRLIAIEIKQNKEDMEEIESVKAKDIYEKIAGRKIPCLVNDRDGNLVEGTGTVCGYKGKWVVLGFDSTYEGCIGSFTDTVYIDKLFQSYRFWNVKHINIDVNNIDTIKLKPFSLKSAKAGKPVCTRDGRKARIICFDAKCGISPIIALIENCNNEEIHKFHKDGKLFGLDKNEESFNDLMMLPEKKEGWVNVYKDSVYDTKDEAIDGTYVGRGYIDTVKVSWEE